MGLFQTNRSFPYTPPSLAPVAEQVMQGFRDQGYEVTGNETAGGGQFISITKGDTFKAVLGLKTALNVTITPTSSGTDVEAKVGTYGEAFIGAAVGAFIFWPLILTQVAGMIENSKLDDKALAAIEQALRKHSDGTVTTAPSASTTAGAGTGTSSTGVTAGATAGAADTGSALFCAECGATLPAGARFCLQCGTKVAAA